MTAMTPAPTKSRNPFTGLPALKRLTPSGRRTSEHVYRMYGATDCAKFVIETPPLDVLIMQCMEKKVKRDERFRSQREKRGFRSSSKTRGRFSGSGTSAWGSSSTEPGMQFMYHSF